MRTASAAFFGVLIGLISYGAMAQVVETMIEPIDASGGVSVDQVGNIYVADFGPTLNGGGTTVYKVTPAGDLSTFATGLNGASGNTFDAEGNLYQSNINLGVVSKITPDGTVSEFSTGHSSPVGVAVNDSTGDVFVANCGSGSIRRTDAAGGASSAFATSGLLGCSNGLTIDDDGNLYTVNFNNGSVLKITPNAEVTQLATIPGGGNGHLTFVNDRLYVVSRGGHSIYRVSLSGDMDLIAGTGQRGRADGPALQAEFSLPNGIAASPSGDTLYINDVVSTTGPSSALNPSALRRIILNQTTTDIEDAEEEVPEGVSLGQNYPNPFSATTTIRFRLAESEFVTLAVYDVLGREVATLIHGRKAAGHYEVPFEAHGLPSGVLYYRLRTDAVTETQRMMVLR